MSLTLADPLAKAREALAVLEREPAVDARGDVVIDLAIAIARWHAEHESRVHLRAVVDALDTATTRADAAEAEVARLRAELEAARNEVRLVDLTDLLTRSSRVTTTRRATTMPDHPQRPEVRKIGLFRNDPETREGKYPVLLRRDGTVPEWEWFVLGERDPAAPFAIRAYADEAERRGFDPAYVRDLREMADTWDRSQALEADLRAKGLVPEKPADPDGPRHRKDDPDVLQFPRTLAAFKSRVDRDARRRLLKKVDEIFDAQTGAVYDAANEPDDE